MTTLFVLAANAGECEHWIRENKLILKFKKLSPKYISSNGISYLGHKDCHFVEVGSFWATEKHDTMYSYFNSHNIIRLHV